MFRPSISRIQAFKPFIQSSTTVTVGKIPKASSSPASSRWLSGETGPKKRISGHGQPSLLKQALKPSPNVSGRETMRIGQVLAYSTAEEYDLGALHQRMAEAGQCEMAMFNVLGEAIWIPKWSPRFLPDKQSSQNEPHPDNDHGEIFVFESGSFVGWGLSSQVAEVFFKEVIRSESSAKRLERNPSRIPEKETIDYLKSNTGPMFAVDADQIVVGPIVGRTSLPTIPTRTLLSPFLNASITSPKVQPTHDPLLLSKLAVSSALVRACRLSRYEAQLDEFLSKVEHVPQMLKSGNDSPLNKSEIVARYGELLELRQGLSLNEENLLDLPEWFWEDTGAEELHFKKILKEFDFERRLRVLNDKLGMAIELQGRLFEFVNSKYSHRLEWVIIILIAFEIAHAIFVAGHHREVPPTDKEALAV
ncbi:hypothetical protein O181_031319 [Austropuccinia psidii MF-1]|uniref:DUF155 domain-containing protein n=1 Tax=Austropuccinia psidii MF-1 TaxID=1389203 RepID=A0A9Q3H6E8_9BASI|nr:hypothetical protein [Austropuccinia psidii MF-1]